ncbi:MAG: caspase family protein [Rhodospirillales bacterium]|nr:caspase family protein [Rhodospirillales bacterium]
MRRLHSMKHAVLAAALGFILFASCAPTQAWAQGEKRVALVIGNAAYKDAPLQNPVNDARGMAARLRQLGFDVVMRENATRAHVASAIAEFTAKTTPSTVALFFYAGHGIQVRGRNYLIPVDAAIESESAVAFSAIDVAQIGDEIEQAGVRVRLIVLDACRNNPFEKKLRGVGQSRGLAPMDAARGSLVAFATAPGSVAADGDGANSVYTGALLKALAVPGLKAEDVFKRARLSVLEQTRGAQTPWEQSALTGDLVLHAAPAAVPTAAAPTPELLFWQSAHAANRLEEYEAYLRQYPEGSFAALARARVAAVKPVAPTAAPLRPAAAPARPATPPAKPTAEDDDHTLLVRAFAQAVAPPGDAGRPAEAMMRRAEALAAVGDHGGARLFYERLALAGDARAALALARSYDPGWLRQQGVVGVAPDLVRAAYWYARAEAFDQSARISAEIGGGTGNAP